jgi:hypothetical protein
LQEELLQERERSAGDDGVLLAIRDALTIRPSAFQPLSEIHQESQATDLSDESDPTTFKSGIEDKGSFI